MATNRRTGRCHAITAGQLQFWVAASAAHQLSAGLSRWAVRFEAVAVGVDNESGIVVGIILGSQVWLPIVAAASSNRGGMEGRDTFGGGSGKAEVQPRVQIGLHWAVDLADPKCNLVSTVTECSRHVMQANITKGRQCRIIKPLASGKIAHPDRYVVDHWFAPNRIGQVGCCSATRADATWQKLRFPSTNTISVRTVVAASRPG